MEGPEKVTGRSVYSADVTPPGVLWGANVLSPHPHARILAIDASRALAVPGVRLVLTAADIPNRRIGRHLKDQPILCEDRVRFVGDKVAAVAAEDPDAAQEGTLRVQVDYEVLPAVFDPLAAMEPGAPLVHAEAGSYVGYFQGIPQGIPNVCGYRVHHQGDVAAGFAEADLVVEHTLRTSLAHQAYLEPHACVVSAAPGGRAEVWASNKVPYNLRREFAEAIGRPEHDVLVRTVTVGGDFGSKGGPGDGLAAYHLSRLTGRPVKFVTSSHEDLVSTSHRHPSLVTLRTGVKRDGTIVARSARIIFNTGAYGGLKPNADGMLNGADHAGGPYRIPNLYIEAFAVYTNLPPSGYMRAPGHPQVVFAVEAHMDLVARELGMDPLEFRLRNVVRQEATGADSFAPRVLQAAADAIGWGSGDGGQGTAIPAPSPRPPSPLIGRGLAMAVRGTGVGEATGDVTLDPDGTIVVRTAAPDNGTGALTVVAQIVAEEFGLPMGRVRLMRVETDALPVDVGAGASRMTNVAGHAVLAACQKLKEQLAPLAARMLGVEVAAWEGGGWRADGPAGGFLSLEDLAGEMVKPGDPLAHAQVTLAQARSPDRGYGVQAAEVEVDSETGQVQLRRMVSVQDTGTIINPLGHQGQIDGGAVQGLGLALMEELVVEDGRIANGHLGEYKLPTSKDAPPLATIHIPSTGPGPWGAKAIGELPSVPGAGAIANAVADAIGAPILELPITAERVLAALDSRRAERRSVDPQSGRG